MDQAHGVLSGWAEIAIGCEARADEAWARLGGACDVLGRAEMQVFEWRKRNPKPEWHEDQFAERNEAWQIQDETVERQHSVPAAREQQDAANSAISEAVDNVCSIRATTIEGFRCKARLADKLRDSDLAWSIVDDLQAMVAE
jgi:hypothetical protein